VKVTGSRSSIRLEPLLWETIELICKKEDLRKNDFFKLAKAEAKDIKHNEFTSVVRERIVGWLRLELETMTIDRDNLWEENNSLHEKIKKLTSEPLGL
jgi:predicted DNA-binding ribbon-helix-helix protein